MGFFDSGPQVNQRQSRDGQRCVDWTCRVEPGDDGQGADPREPEYVDLPTPTDTRGLLKVTPGSDIWVYSVGDSTSWGWIEAGDTFFVRCRTYAPRSDALIIAGTQYAVDADEAFDYTDLSRRKAGKLPRCSPSSAHSSSAPPPTR